MSEQIIVRIRPDGTIQAETKGIKGPKCLASLDLLEQLLDAEVESSAFTDEYTQTEAASKNEIDDELSQR
ncbi:DUF2997 domain-containing protein [uncultured Phycicoccus sp.]|uniref:DUF2997 domain-containing protein n=1 Tax=uncultured Phycicoccus sp. TaxID=661422 RepID=UPI0026269C64|nr:DUF2997 domain-containing protein [uncultured Phycicoccus sp.]